MDSGVAQMVWEWVMRMKTEHGIWCNGSGDQQPLLDWGAESTLSPAFIPNCRLQDFFDLIFPKTLCWHSPDLLVFTQVVPFWASLRNNHQVHGRLHAWPPTQCFQVHAFMTPVILPSGSGLGVCNKAIILRKTWKIIINTVLNICRFSRCYFCGISQGWESTLLGIPTTPDGQTQKMSG